MERPNLRPDDLMRLPKDVLVEMLVAMAGDLDEAKSLDLAYARQIEELSRSAGKNGRNSGKPPLRRFRKITPRRRMRQFSESKFSCTVDAISILSIEIIVS